MLNRLSYILIFTVLFTSCEKDKFCNCLKGSGSVITEERNIEAFNIIEMNNNVDLIFTPDSIFKLKVTCGKNIIDGISTTVENGRLVIKNNNKCNWLRDLKSRFTVEVSGNGLNELTTYGSGNVNFTDTLYTPFIRIASWDGTGDLDFLINADRTEISIATGPVNIILHGNSINLGAYSGGNGFLFAEDFVSDFSWTTNQGTGDFYLNVSKELKAEIRYTGDIYYSGDPYKITSNVTGTGNLYKK